MAKIIKNIMYNINTQTGVSSTLQLSRVIKRLKVKMGIQQIKKGGNMHVIQARIGNNTTLFVVLHEIPSISIINITMIYITAINGTTIMPMTKAIIPTITPIAAVIKAPAEGRAPAKKPRKIPNILNRDAMYRGKISMVIGSKMIPSTRNNINIIIITAIPG